MSESFQLSFAQQRLWFLQHLPLPPGLYHIPLALRLKGNLCVPALQRAFNKMLERHAILRSIIKEDMGIAQQIILPVTAFNLELEECSDENNLTQELHFFAEQPFDISHKPMWRAKLLRVAVDESILVIIFHHLIADAWSIDIFLKELTEFFCADIAGKPIQLPPLPQQYIDFADWQRRQFTAGKLDQQVQYWKDHLGNSEENFILPTDKQGMSQPSYRGAMHRVILTSDLVQQLKLLAQQGNCSLFILLLSAFQVLLRRYSGQNIIRIGTPFANRHYQDTESLIGLFVNTVVMQANCDIEMSFADLLLQTRQHVLAAYENQDLPFEQLVDALHISRQLNRHPLFQVMFAFESSLEQELKWPDLQIEWLDLRLPYAKFDLTLWVKEQPAGLCLEFEYATDLFFDSSIISLAQHFINLLQGIVAQPQQAIGRLPLLSAAERQKILCDSNPASLAYPHNSLIHELIAQQVASQPQATALTCAETRLTYQALHYEAEKLTGYLQQQGIIAADRIIVCLPRSVEWVIAVLAVLKAGATYVPIETDGPIERTKHILTDTQAAAIITDEHFKPNRFDSLIKVNQHTFASAKLQLSCYLTSFSTNRQRTELAISSQYLAYIIYTSGSTGIPKGVMVSHQNISSYIYAFQQAFNVTVRDKFDFSSPVGFDFSLTCSLLPLVCGAEIVIYPGKKEYTPELYLQYLARENITFVKYTPGYFSQLLSCVAAENKLPALRFIILGGEALAAKSVHNWLRKYPQHTLVNEYGPTETTVAVSYQIINYENINSLPDNLPIGKAFRNSQLYVLNELGEPCPIGVAGEIYIGGENVAQGYLNQPDLTQEKFLPAFFAESLSARLYKSGDLGCYLPDGKIQYLGRRDLQVKVRGYRIDLNEIEAILLRQPAINQAVVIVQAFAKHEQRLTAYLVVDSNNFSEQVLREYLRDYLPVYMLPQQFVYLDTLPLDKNGKIDRQALPTVSQQNVSLATDEKTDEQAIISAIWAELLNIPAPDRQANFFDLGGNSFLLLQLRSRLEDKLKIKLSITELFAHPSITSLTNYLRQDYKADDQKPLLSTIEDNAVAIIGMAGKFPGADNVADFWQNLLSAKETIQFFSEQELSAAGIAAELLQNPDYVKAKGYIADADLFAAGFFNISAREAESMDPQYRLFLECAWHALEDAAYVPDEIDARVGIYAGANSMPTYLTENILSNSQFQNVVGDYQLGISNLVDFLATRVAYKLNLRGPAITVQTACSTALTAVCQACQSLVNRQCDMALAGAVNISLPLKTGYLHQLGMITSPDGHCRPFDAKAQGMVPADGLGIVVLKRLADAVRDHDQIYAVIKAYGLNNDAANKVGFTAPSLAGQVACIKQAHDMANLKPAAISYVEAHGTATPLGDSIEIAALKQAFLTIPAGEKTCAIGSVKSNIGHLNTAAGIAGLIKTALAIRHRVLPASLHYQTANPELGIEDSPFYVNSSLQAWEKAPFPLRAGVSSFGVGGTNVHVVLEEAAAQAKDKAVRTYQLIVLSAQSPTALIAMRRALSEYLLRTTLSLADVAYTLQVGRKAFAFRHIIVADNLPSLLQQLQEPAANLTYSNEITKQTDTKIVFLFPGQGSQYIDMAKTLYISEPIFHECIDTCAELLLPYSKRDIRHILYPEDAKDEAALLLSQTEFLQAILFSVEYALAKLWLSWDVTPDYMLGHSLGEYVAACLAGVISLEDALFLLVERGKLLQSLSPGAMLAVRCSRQQIQTLLTEKLSIAAINNEDNFVIAGNIEAIEELNYKCHQQHIPTKLLPVTRAFHSHLVEPILAKFEKLLQKISLHKPKQLYISNLNGQLIDPEQVITTDYWLKHLRQPVNFAAGLGYLMEKPNLIFLELGAGCSIINLAQQQAKQSQVKITAISCLPAATETNNAEATLMLAVGKLWAAGVKINWRAFHQPVLPYRVSLPTYPFERQRYWVEVKTKPQHIVQSENDFLYQLTWQVKNLTANQTMTLADRAYLIFLDQKGLGLNLAKQLNQQGSIVYAVTRNDENIAIDFPVFVINELNYSDYEKLANYFQQGRNWPTDIIYLWNLDQESFNNKNTDFYSLLFLVKTLQQAVRLCLITDRAQVSHMSHEPVNVGGAAAIALLRVIAQELPFIQTQNIDIDMQQLDSKLSKLLQTEINAPLIDRSIAYRNGKRWVAYLSQADTQVGQVHNLIRNDGVYLITGGLGNIGLALAQYLAQDTPIKLVLLNRSGFIQPEEWADYLADHSDDDTVSQKIKAIQAIQKNGSEVFIAIADVSQKSQLASALAAIKSKYGAINAVIHAAGNVVRSDEENILTLSPQQSELHFTTKLTGLINLNELLADQQLDFLVVISSLASLLGGIGLAAYAAANAAMDNFVLQLQREKNYPCWIMNWDDWSFQETSNTIAITSQQGCKLFTYLLQQGITGQFFISKRNLNEQFKQWVAFQAQAKQNKPVGKLILSESKAETDVLAEQLLTLWREYLGEPDLQLNDNFFEFGGDSLMIVRLVSRISQDYGVNILPTALLQCHIIHEQIKIVAKKLHEKNAEVQKKFSLPFDIARPDTIPLSYAQQRLWFLDQLVPNSALYNMPFAYQLQGKFDVGIFKQALTALVQRHESLRTQIFTVDGKGVQVIKAETLFDWSVLEWTHLKPQQQIEKLDAILAEEFTKPFNLARDPLLRITIIILEPEKHVVLITLHHIISDGWSMGIIFKELQVLYQAYQKNSMPDLVTLQLQYADFTLWQRGWLEEHVLEQQLQYWNKQLVSAPPLLLLPTDRPRPVNFDYQGDSYQLIIAESQFAAIKKFIAKEQITLFTFLLTIFAVLLHRYSQQEQVVIGVPTANRHYPGVENVIGFFVNTLAITSFYQPENSFIQFLQQIKFTVLAAFDNQDAPLDRIIDQLNLKRDLSYNPLFQVLFTLQNTDDLLLELNGLHSQELMTDAIAEQRMAKFDISLVAKDEQNKLSLSFEFSKILFDRSTISRMAGHYVSILQEVLKHSDIALSHINLLSTAEKQQQLYDWNATTQIAYLQNNIIQLFEAQVFKQPLAIALLYQEQQLSYQALNAQANQLAHYLQKLGVHSAQIIAVLLERSCAAFITILAILKSGAAYLPIDPETPIKRIAWMLEDSNTKLVITQSDLLANLSPQFFQIICIDQVAEAICQCSENNLETVIAAHDLAYMIYTSGSTGKPKGVLIEHIGLNNLALAQAAYFGITHCSRILQFAALSFDASVSEWAMAFSQGATLCLLTEEQRRDAEQLSYICQRYQVDVATLPASLVAVLPTEQFAILKTLIVAGEAPSQYSLARWPDTINIFNAYGPTEATVCASIAKYIAGQAATIIGKPLANTKIYILDKYLQIVPIGVVGEIYIGGIGLARGYCNNTALTQEKFITYSFDNNGQLRLYKTGDLARYLSDGRIEYCGRSDTQIKLHGYRIELSEIESNLLQYLPIHSVKVLVQDNTYKKQLLAFLVTENRHDLQTLPSSYWQEKLKQHMPDYMLPDQYIFVDELPLTANGKIDQQALLTRANSYKTQQRSYIAARNPIESTLVQIWEEVLQVKPIGINDNFFQLGGDSIISIQVISCARQQGLKLSVKQLFAHPHIAELAAQLSLMPVSTTKYMRNEPEGILLSPIQQWFFSQEFSQPQYWNQAVLLQSKEVLKIDYLRAAWQFLIQHHVVLRYRFVKHVAGWKAISAAYSAEQEICEVIHSAENDWQNTLNRHATKLQADLNLSTGPLFKVALFDCGRQGQYLLIILHHLITDGVSWSILLNDLAHLYQQAELNDTLSLPYQSNTYSEWTAALQVYADSPVLKEQLVFWINTVRKHSADVLGRFKKINNIADASLTIKTQLSERNTELLVQANKAYHTKTTDLLLSALMLTINELLGESDFYFDLEGHGREDIAADLDLSHTIGWFTSLFPVYLSLPKQINIEETIKSVKEQLRRIPQNGIGYGLLRYMARDARQRIALNSSPSLCFNYLGYLTSPDKVAPLWTMANYSIGQTSAAENFLPHSIEINVFMENKQLVIGWSYRASYFKNDYIEKVAENYLLKVEQIIKHCCELKYSYYTPADFPQLKLSQTILDQLTKQYPQFEDIYFLSPLQQGLLFHHLCKPDNDDYLLQTVMEIRGQFNTKLFRLVWEHLVKQQSTLRTVFLWQQAAKPLQLVLSAEQSSLPWQEWNLSHLSAAEQQASLTEFLLQDRRQGLNLQQPPLFRLNLIRLATQHYYLVFTHHHILSDGWSAQLFWQDVISYYSQLNMGQGMITPCYRPSYRYYVDWLSKQDEIAAKQFWSHYLKDVTAGTLLVPNVNKETLQNLEEESAVYSMQFSEQQLQAYQTFVHYHHLTLNTLLMSVWGLVLSVYLQCTDLIFGVVTSGRSIELPDIEDMIGLLINTVPLRLNFNPTATSLDILQSIQIEMAELQQYTYLSLADIQKDIMSADNSLFDTLFVFENYPVKYDEKSSSNLFSMVKKYSIEYTEYPLTVMIMPGEKLTVQFAYHKPLLKKQQIQQLATLYNTLLDHIVAQPTAPLHTISLLRAAEKQRMIIDWNNTSRELSNYSSIHSLFEQQVKHAPEAIAIKEGDNSLTYSSLNCLANQLANYLIKHQAQREELIAVYLTNSIDYIIAILGILKAGAAYLSIDLATPQEKITFILQETKANKIITQATIGAQLQPFCDMIIYMDNFSENFAAYSTESPTQKVDCRHLAYVVYTSGTTGQPKGVMIEHGAVIRLVNNTNYIQITSADYIAQAANIAFDAATFEIWGALLNGATLVLTPKNTLLSAAEFKQFLAVNKISILWLTTSLFNQFATIDAKLFAGLRYLLIGGEKLNPSTVKRVLEQGRDAPKYLLNGYGPTENTTFSLIHTICYEDCLSGNIPIGRPIANSTAYILDPYLRPLPVGVVGELYVGGCGLARSYLQQEKQTAEKFIINPFANNTIDRLYKTGDLARYREDGSIEFVGRSDQQVKIHGYRVELEEVVACIEQWGGAEQVLVRPEKQDNDIQLMAYLLNQSTVDEVLATQQLRNFLQSKLPAYMLPTAYIFLKELPLTVNGKLDEAALPRLQAAVVSSKANLAPRNMLEWQLVQLWKEILKVEKLGIEDNFFTLGGHSLLVIKLLAELKTRFKLNLSVGDFYAQPTIAKLASNATIAADFSPVSQLNAEAYKTPLILVHPIDGLAICYQALAELLPDVPLYLLSDPALLSKHARHESIESAASYYISHILKLLPSGPYRVAGWSFGGTVALEMAQQLQKQGHIVELTLLIDSYNFSNQAGKMDLLLASQLDSLRESFNHEENNTVFKMLEAEIIHNIQLLKSYITPGYSGRLVLLKAQDEIRHSIFSDNFSYGWDGFKQLEIQAVPGTHSSLFAASHIKSTADAIKNIIDNANSACI